MLIVLFEIPRYVIIVLFFNFICNINFDKIKMWANLFIFYASTKQIILSNCLITFLVSAMSNY